MGWSRSISFKTKRRKLIVMFLIGLFLLPIIIFSLGLTSFTIAKKDININNILGEDQGSSAIQLSLYASLSSYNYLTNETILRALNGTAFGGGALIPAEILLLVAEYELQDSGDALKLAEIV
ncbi:MAG: hypothetical protein ACTSQQ_13445, partial [Candidatus Helarchaeota archaeon]